MIQKRKNLKKLDSVTNGEQIIYEIIQLWNYHDKLKADFFEDAILEGVSNAATKLGLGIKSYPIFMPFRDSDEEDIVIEDKGKAIYEADMERINSSTFAMIGFSDGLVKDGGSFFEYGRAFAYKLPTLLFISDFFYFANRYKDWSSYTKEGIVYVIDPIIQSTLGKVVLKNDLPMIEKDLLSTSRDYKKQRGKKEQFRKRLEAGIDELRASICSETQKLCLNPEKYIKDINIFPRKKRNGYVYLEMEGICEWQIEKMETISEMFAKYGVSTRTPKRYDPNIQQEFSKRYGDEAIAYLGLEDLKTAAGASAIIVSGEGWDVPVGSAFVQGCATALGIPVILYYTANRQFNAKGGTETLLNLMLEYSSSYIASSTLDLIHSTISFLEKK